MNLFQIDFIQGKTDAADYAQVKHSLTDTAVNRLIISLGVSPDKLQSVSNYSREPKRLTFECFPTSWIEENILSGDNEHERYISHYEVKAYRDGVLFFTGIIDTSKLSFDVSTGILKFTCYDKIKLLSTYSDLTHFYSQSAGYLPIWILAYFLQDIEQAIPINIPYSSQFSLPELSIAAGSALTLAHIDFDDLLDFPDPPGGWAYSYDASGMTSPYNGYRVDSTANTVRYIFAYSKVIKATYPSPAVTRYQGRYIAKIYEFHNNICPVLKEYSERTDWVDDLPSLDNAYNEFMSFFTDNGISQATLTSGLTSTGVLGAAYYASSQYSDQWVEAKFHGNLFPAKLHPGKFYEGEQQERTSNLKALQAMLMLYNATIFTTADGTIVLKNKDATSATTTDIADTDVVSLVIARTNQEVPDTQAIDVLAGDTGKLQGILRQYLVDFYNSIWSISGTIDQLSKYSLGLQSKIRIKGKVYAIVELDADFLNDEYKVKAWLQ